MNDQQYFQRLALEKMLKLQEQMVQKLRDHPIDEHSSALIHNDFMQYVEAMKSAHLDRIMNFDHVQQLKFSLMNELEPNTKHVLDDIQELQVFLSQGRPIHQYEPSAPVEPKQLRPEKEQDHGYDGPSF